jgi:zinc-ribbon domain
MFCDRCGASLSPNARFCTGCGKPVVQAAVGQAPYVSAPVAQGRVRRHIQPLATLWLINGILRLMTVGWMMVFGSMFFPFMRSWGGPVVWPFGRAWGLDFLLSRGLFSLGMFLALFGVLHLVLAWGLFERQPWARTLGCCASRSAPRLVSTHSGFCCRKNPVANTTTSPKPAPRCTPRHIPLELYPRGFWNFFLTARLGRAVFTSAMPDPGIAPEICRKGLSTRFVLL